MSNGKSTALQNTVLANLSGARIALCMTSAPTEDSAATGLTAGGGYSPGGKLIDIGAIADGIVQGPNGAALTWTNTSGASWVITGVVVHTAGTAHPSASQMLYYSDEFTVAVPHGGALELPIDALTFTEV